MDAGTFTPEDTAENGNRFLVGNGYIGVCGTLDEHGAGGLPTEKCLVVEDAEAGIQAARAGCFDSAGIGPAARCGLASYAMEDFRDLLDIIFEREVQK